MKKTILVTLLVLLLVGVTACGGNSTDSAEPEETAEKVTIAGSTSVQPLSELLAETFMSANEGVEIEVQGGGSGQGIKSIEESIADLGALSREVKDEEKSVVGEEYIIAQDGIAVIVNLDTEVEDLTIEQIKKIYTGEITNWKDVGGPDEEIVVVSREEGSGTRTAFTEITGVTEKDASGNEVDNTIDSALIQGSTGALKQTVASTPNSIGYISLGVIDDTISAIKVEGVEPSNETVLDGKYALSRPFIYVRGTGELSETVELWIEFVLSEEGQAIVEEAGFIPVA